MQHCRAVISYEPMPSEPWNAKLQNVSIRDIDPDECLVEVVASGICHTDLGIAARPGSIFPDQSIAFCGSCPSCSSGHPSYCYDAYKLNFAHPGCDAYAQDTSTPVVGGFFGQSSLGNLAVVKASCIVNLSGIVKSREELQLFAPLGCGLAGVMAAKIIGCRRIIAVDRIPERLVLATELGATHTIHTGELTTSLANAVRLATDGIGSSLTIETTGALPIIQEALDMTSILGRVVPVGMSKEPLQTDMTKFKLAGKSLLGSMQGGVIPSKYITQMIEWYREGEFPIEELIRFYKPEDHVEVQDMKAGPTVKPIIHW
ncbi:hypothetical protein ASPVEDRAFT_876829 [Aspergillus versicolor CBS 583.65]|uniref:Alcohol dehydrogenase-like C-terminal domain-containing protein n=1 Tax=Aspergillus versicolor CBS 583.65 TaxID=1036611 RepID=A0A1L9Q061_ASPVE|nr:uncharacterized protein ASPVEDRAFT_876829 [Aspergillus versicolor CBS 583.65]OJJ07161.1 hypothetical protein ASPVEDRAFT_876829 [Aspergillus versicolor CBS 583.65]